MTQKTMEEKSTALETTSNSTATGNATAANNVNTASQQGRLALRELLSPVKLALNIGNVMAVISATLRVFPFVALVGIGNELMAAATEKKAVNEEAVEHLVIVLIATFCGGLFAYFIGLLITHVADNRLSASIQRRVIDSLGKAPLTWFSENTSGHVRKVIQDDVKSLHVLIAHRPVDSLISVLLPIFSAVYAFVIDWRLGLVVIFPIVVYVCIYGVMMRGMTSKSTELESKFDDVSASMIEFVRGIQVVKTFGITGKAHRRYADKANEACDFMEEWNRPMINAASVTAAIVSTPVMVLLFAFAGIFLVQKEWVTPVEVVAGCLIAISLPSSINLVANMAWNYQMAGAAAKRIVDLVNVTELPAPAQSLSTPAQASVEFDDVYLSYGKTNALQGVSLVCSPGTITALMGPSGAGKSTLAKLAARFMDPDQGRVLIGGVNVKDLSRDDLYRQVSFVLQDAQILRASIRENITMGKAEASAVEIENVARKARIHDEIMAMPKGYDTVVGQDIKLSGGQAQRISIARALLMDTPILILDEAAAMVDPECEAQIQEAINELTLGKTVIVIDHRPSSVRHVDQIALFEHGRLLACGPHEKMLEQELYKRLCAASGTQLEESGIEEVR